MVIVLGLAAGLVIGAPLPALAALGLAVWQPVWALGTIVAWATLTLRRTDSTGDELEAAYLQAVASELRAGLSLRHALSTAANRTSGLPLDRAVRLASAGQPLGRVAEELGRALPRLGVLAASAVRTAAVTGGRGRRFSTGLPSWPPKKSVWFESVERRPPKRVSALGLLGGFPWRICCMPA